MAELTEEEINILNREIVKEGLTYTELQQELLDHLCCDVEAEMEDGLEFIKALEKVRKGMGKDRIQKIQEETLLLINQKYRMMKKFMYVLGIIAPSALIVGTIFKIMHWPGAGVLLTLSLFLLGAIYLPVFVMVKIRDTRKKGKQVNMPMYIFGMIAGIVFIAGAMFKIQHWPGAGAMITLSGIVTVLVFIPILVIQAVRDKENQVQNFTILIFVLSFVAITFMMYALRVSKDVLNAFTLTYESLNNTSDVIENRNATYMNLIDLSDPGSDALMSQVQNVNEKADELDDYIQGIKVQMVVRSHDDGRDAVDEDGNIDLLRVYNKDNIGCVEMVLFGDGGDVPGKGKELRAHIDDYRELLLETASPNLAYQIGLLLSTSPRDDNYPSWEDYKFRMVPLMGALTQLENIQTNIRFAQGEVLYQLLRQE